MANNTRLPLHENLFLLSTKDDGGYIDSNMPQGNLFSDLTQFGLFGELVLQDRLQLQPNKGSSVLLSKKPLGNKMLDEALSVVIEMPSRVGGEEAQKDPWLVCQWIGRLTNTLGKNIGASLVEKGICSKKMRKQLLLFSFEIFPIAARETKRTIERSIVDAIEGDGTLDERTSAIISIFAGCTHLNDLEIWNSEWLRRKDRIKEICDSSLLNQFLFALAEALLEAHHAPRDYADRG